jgi:hypothetical protein
MHAHAKKEPKGTGHGCHSERMTTQKLVLGGFENKSECNRVSHFKRQCVLVIKQKI